MSREGIEKKIESIQQSMKRIMIQYSDYEDQLSDLYSDLALLDKENHGSEKEEE